MCSGSSVQLFTVVIKQGPSSVSTLHYKAPADPSPHCQSGLCPSIGHPISLGLTAFPVFMSCEDWHWPHLEGDLTTGLEPCLRCPQPYSRQLDLTLHIPLPLGPNLRGEMGQNLFTEAKQGPNREKFSFEMDRQTNRERTSRSPSHCWGVRGKK